MKWLLLFLFSSTITWAQTKNARIDSLLIEIKKQKADTLLINDYFLLAREYQYVNPKKLIITNKKILELSKKQNFTKGFAHYNLIQGIIYMSQGDYKSSLLYADKSMMDYKKVKFKQGYFSSITLKTNCYLNTNELEKAFLTANIGIETSKNTTFFNDIANFNYCLSTYYFRNKNFKKAIFYLNKAITNYRKIHNLDNLVICYNGIAGIYYYTNQLKKSLEYTKLAISLNKDKYSEIQFLSNIANIYIELKNYVEAMKYSQLSLKKSYEINNISFIAININNIAAINYEQKKYNLAIENANKVLVMTEEGSNIKMALQIIGNSYFSKGNYKKAFYYQKTVIDSINQSKSKHADQIESKNIYNEIAKTECALGNYKEAYEYSKLDKQISEAILIEEKTNRINELQTQFHVNEKEIALQNSLLQNKNSKFKIQNQKNYIYCGLLLLLIIVIILFLLTWIFYIKNMKNIVLEEQKIFIEKANSDLLQSQALLKKNMEEKDMLLREIHHRVKNNLQLVISLLNIQSRQVESSNIEVFLEKSLSRITTMSLIHENLYQNDHIGKVNFNEYLASLIESILSTFSNINQRIKVDIKIENIFFEIENAISLGLIINELLYNAFKHAFPEEMNGKILITIVPFRGGYKLVFKDNGVGFSKNLIEKDTLGIKLVRLLSQQLNGELIIKQLKGTTFQINFTGKKID